MTDETVVPVSVNAVMLYIVGEFHSRGLCCCEGEADSCPQWLLLKMRGAVRDGLAEMKAEGEQDDD